MTAPAQSVWTGDQVSHLYSLFYGEMNLCGCGSPWDAFALVRQLLDLTPFYDHRAEVAALFAGNDGAEHIVLSVLDNADLIEHGGSIGGSWITDKGRAVQALLGRVPVGDLDELDDALDHAGYPHDGGVVCSEGCWSAWVPS